MVCNGVLPIDNMKDYLSPIDLLVDRIPKVYMINMITIVIDSV